MRVVGIKVLKNKLSEYIRLASQGETILVSNRDRVVAEIHPPLTGRAEALEDAVLAEAVRRGWLTPPLARQRSTARHPIAPLEEILRDLAADRDDR